MSIKLEYILRRNKSNLAKFIQKNKLTTYQRLIEYCDSRKFIPCTEEEFNEVAKKRVTRNERERASGKVGKTQEPKKRRYRRKKQQDTPKLPDSSDDG